MAKAFITYSHEDSEFVDELVEQIETATNVVISIDKRVLAPGDSLTKIFAEIENSDFLLPVLSANSINSEWCKKELCTAIIKEIEESAFKVVPIVKQGEGWKSLQQQMPSELKGALRDKVMARFDIKEYKEAFKDLIRALTPEQSPEDIYAQIEDLEGENPFRRLRAEHFFEDPQIFARLFAEPVPDHDKIISPKPTFIEGGRGTGKSMILKSLQARFAVSRKQARSFTGAELPYFGVYCKMSRESFTTTVVEHISREVIESLFYTELVLRLAQSLIDEIKSCSNQSIIQLDASLEREFARKAGRYLRLDSEQATDLDMLNLLINERLDEINDYIDKTTRSGHEPDEIKSLKARHLENLCKSVRHRIPDLKKCTIFFLADEYENLADFQKKVLNTLIKRHTAETWSFKVAVKKTGFNTAQTLEGQELEEGHDYSRVDLDFDILDPTKPAYKRYVDYIKLICQKILNAEGFKQQDIENLLEERKLSHDGLTEDSLLAEMKAMLKKRNVNWEDLDLKKQQQYRHHYEMAAYYRLLKSKRRKFGGFDDFMLLSSGIVRTFLELCGGAYYFARQDGKRVKDGDKISVYNQTEAAYTLSEYHLWNIRKNIEEFGPIIHGLVVDLGDIFKQKLLKHPSEPEAARVAISHPLRLGDLMVTIPREKRGRQSSLKYDSRIGFRLPEETQDQEEHQVPLKRILDATVEHSVFHEYESRGGRRPRHLYDEPPYDYILNRIFAPSLGYSPRPRWSTKFESGEIRNLLDPARRTQTKQQLFRKVTTESEEQPTLLDKVSEEEMEGES